MTKVRRARSVLLLACLCCIAPAAFAAGIPIRGQVLDSGGAPLAKVQVRLVPIPSAQEAGRLELEGKDGPEAAASAQSGADGFFRLEAPAVGMWKVIVEGDRLVPQEAETAPLVSDLDLPAVRLQRDAGLAVRVLGPGGRPVPGARVRSEPASPSLRSSWQVSSRVAVTNAEGRAVLPRAGSGALNVRAGAPGFGPAERKETRASSLDLRLATGPPLPLRVLGAAGKPAAGVLVLAEGGAPLGRTGEGGLLDLAAPDGAPLDVVLAGADGARLEGARVRPLGSKEPRAPRELRLPAVREIAVRTVSAADSRPIPGSIVWITEDPGTFQRADPRGEARLMTSAESSVVVRTVAAGFQSADARSNPAPGKPRKPLTLSLQPDLAVAGIVVTETGAPVGGAEITVSNVDAGALTTVSQIRAFRTPGLLVRSGPDGRFRWSGLAPGAEVELRAAKEGFAPSLTQVTPPEPGGRPAAPLRIVLRRGASAFGRILGADRRPIAGAQVSLQTAESGDLRARMRAIFQRGERDAFDAVTGADGRFDLANLPAGRYDLTAKGRGWAPLTVPGLEVPDASRATDLGTLVLARGVALEGEVVDAAGRPVEGAEVRLNEAGGRMFPRFREEDSEPEAVSGADGFFRIEDLRAGGTVDVSVVRSGYAPGSAQGVQVPADPPVRIALQDVGAVSGRVVDPDGKPIAGASVRVEVRPWGRGGSRAFRLPSDQTDAEGSFRIADVTPGPVSLVAEAPGRQEGSVAGLELRGGEEKRGVEIVLSPAAVLAGQVLSPAGRAVPQARVRIVAEGRGGRFQASLTDDDGHYVLDGLAPGLLTVEASHDEQGAARRQIELRVGESSLDLTLEAGREVSGRTLDDTGAPVAGAQVWLMAGGRPPASTRSQSDGGFRFAAVQDGSYRAGAEKEGFARVEPVEVTVEGSSVTGLEIRLSRGGAIAGRITGVDVADLARVQIRVMGHGLPAGTRIEPDGSYRIDHIQEGEWHVRAELPGTGLYAEGVARLEPGASETRLDLEMESGFELSGRVRRNGAPVAGEPLFLSGGGAPAGPQRSFGETDAAGRFRFEGLSAGTYQLRVGSPFGGSGHEETIEIQGDREVTIDLPAADVTGRVVDAADGSPLKGAGVQLLSAGGDSMGRAETDSRGVFVIRGVAEGTWRVRAQADGYAPGETSVQVDGSGAPDGVEISLRATATAAPGAPAEAVLE